MSFHREISSKWQGGQGRMAARWGLGEVRFQGPVPRVRTWSEADGRAEAWPPQKQTDLGWINSGTRRPGRLTLEVKTQREMQISHLGVHGGSGLGQKAPRSPWSLEQLQDREPAPRGGEALTLTLGWGIEATPVGLQPPPGLREEQPSSLHAAQESLQLTSPRGPASPPWMHPGHWVGLWG